MQSHNVYAIGDVHGFAKNLKELLKLLPQNAELIFLGDAINRGPDSLECLRIIQDLGKRATYVLGNHDLHFLAVAAGVRPLAKKDTLSEILEAKDADKIISWLRKQPLAVFKANTLFIHAGVHPCWTIEETLQYANEVHSAIQSEEWKTNLAGIFGNTPAWSESLTGFDRLRAIVNVLTRTRFLYSDGSVEIKSSCAPHEAPADLIPWFDFPGRKTANSRIVCGHWSTCGLTIRHNLITLDSGCYWGRELTAVRIPQLRVWQVSEKKD